MSRKETPVSLAEYVQWYREHANSYLYASDRIEDMRYASGDEPVIPFVSETEGEDVLEDHHASKCFDGDFACEFVRHVFQRKYDVGRHVR